MMQKQSVDNSSHFESSGYPVRDKLYNRIIKRYGEKGNAWKTSDWLIWHGAIYVIWDFVWSLGLIYLLYWVANNIYEHWGIYRAVLFIGAMIIWRMNSVVRGINQLNKSLKP